MKNSFSGGKKKLGKYFQVYILGMWGGNLLNLFLSIQKRTSTSITPNWNWFTAKWNYQISPHNILTEKDKHLQLHTVTVL